MEPSILLSVILPLTSFTVSPGSSFSSVEPVEPVAFGRVVEVIKSRGRVDQLHANRLRLSDNVSLGGVFNLMDARKDQTYTLNIRVTF